MAARYEVEATVYSATDLKNVNWRHGNLDPYAVVWVEPQTNCSTGAAVAGIDFATCYLWNQKLLIPFSTPIEESKLHIDIMQDEAAEDTTPLIGSERRLQLQLKRPSGRPQGKVNVDVSIRKLSGRQQTAIKLETGCGDDYA